MSALRIDDFKQYSHVLHTRKGEPVTLRFLEPGDAGELQNYFRSLSARSRYNRFLGAMSELPRNVLEHFIHVGESDAFSVVVSKTVSAADVVSGAARVQAAPVVVDPPVATLELPGPDKDALPVAAPADSAAAPPSNVRGAQADHASASRGRGAASPSPTSSGRNTKKNRRADYGF